MNAYIKKPFGVTHGTPNIKWQKIIIAAVAVTLGIIGLNIFQAPIKNAFYYATAPASKILWRAGDGVSSFAAGFLNASGLIQENTNLKEENQELLSKIFLLEQSLQSGQAAQVAIQNTQTDNVNLVLAQPISLDTANDILVIDRGSDDGIKENMPVISETKILYGKVLKVYKNFSQVMLVSSKQSALDAKIQQSDPSQPPILGLIKGSGNLSFYLDLVSSDEKMNLGDVVLTSGQEGVFPKDLLLGKITSTANNDLKPFQTAQIQPLFDIKKVQNVFVITDYLQK